MNGIVYLIILENQIVLKLLKRMFKALLRITRTFIFILLYNFAILQLEGAPALLVVSFSTIFLPQFPLNLMKFIIYLYSSAVNLYK